MFLYEALEAVNGNSCTWGWCHQGHWDLGSDWWWNLAKMERIMLKYEGRWIRQPSFLSLKRIPKHDSNKYFQQLFYLFVFAFLFFNVPFSPRWLGRDKNITWTIVTELDMEEGQTGPILRRGCITCRENLNQSQEIWFQVLV